MKKRTLIATALQVAALAALPLKLHAFTFLIDSNPYRWADEAFDPQNPTVTHIYYDFRSQTYTTPGKNPISTIYTNSITPVEETLAQQAMADITTVTGGKVQFIQATAAIPASKIINIGVGDLAAVGETSGLGGTLGEGGINTYIPGNDTSFSSGFAWLDFSEPWDTVLGNGNPENDQNENADFYNVVLHEIGHAIGMGHSSSSDANIMNAIYVGEKLGPAQDDQAGYRALYGTNTTNNNLVTHTLASFTMAFGGQYTNFENDSQGYSVVSYTTDSGTNTITGTTTIATFASEGMYPTFQQDGGIWTHANLVIGGTNNPNDQNINYFEGVYNLTAGSMSFTNSTIFSSGTLTQSGGILTGTTLKTGGQVTLGGGTATISTTTISGGTVFLNSGVFNFTTLSVTTGAFSQTGTFNQTGGTFNGTTLNTAGTVSISGTQNWAAGGSMSITGGGTTLNTDAGSSSTRNLSITMSAGSLAMNVSEHVHALTLTGTSARADLLSDGTLFVADSLSVAVSGTNSTGTTFNLHTSDALILSSDTSRTTYNALVASAVHARNKVASGAALWTGKGLTMMADSAGSTLHTLAIVKDSDLAMPFSATRLFDGEAVSPDNILIKYTYAGDINLDGQINIDDYLTMDAALVEGKAAIYANGDLNYDGTINGADYAIIDANVFAQQSPLASGMIAEHAAEFGLEYVDALEAIAPSAIPEPASLLLLGLGTTLLGCRRPRRHPKTICNRAC